MKKLHIIGLGLLGGSFSLAAQKKFPGIQVSGTDLSPVHEKEALQLGIITEAKSKADPDTDIILLATPVDSLGSLLEETLDSIGENTLVIDLGSTKAPLCRQVETHPKRKHFLAGHPIAGTEYSGPKAAFEELLDGKVMILCELEKTDIHLKEKAYRLFEALSLKLRFMDPEEHDRHLAYVSHLSHISSFMLGKTVLQKMENERNIFDMAGSGFASTVRLAKSNPNMWTPILVENKVNILDALDGYIENLVAIREKIAADKDSDIREDLGEINKIQSILDL